MNTARKKTFSVAQSADYLDRSTKTVRRYLKQGLIEHHMIQGKFGPEIRISKKDLDGALRRMANPSRDREDPLLVLRLFRQASPETQELVMKILKSSRQDRVSADRGGFLRPFFRKKRGEKS